MRYVYRKATGRMRWHGGRGSSETLKVVYTPTKWKRVTTLRVTEVRERQLSCGHWGRIDIIIPGKRGYWGCFQCTFSRISARKNAVHSGDSASLHGTSNHD